MKTDVIVQVEFLKDPVPLFSILAFIWVGKRISKVKRCLGRVVDILEASGTFDRVQIPAEAYN